MERRSRVVLGLPIDSLKLTEAIGRICAMALSALPAYVCFVDAHMLVEAHDNPEIREAVAGAWMRLPDGAPIAWYLKLTNKHAQWLSGPRTTISILEEAERCAIRVGFYGSSPETLSKIRFRLQRDFPELKIVYMHSPPFRELDECETHSDLDAIRSSGTQILFVGLGCPKQERWMHQHSSELPCLLLGVGAAFRILGGETRLPPAWVQHLGFTWLIRLVQEPRRLAHRVLFHLPRFLLLLMLDRTQRTTGV